jgi:threonine/homoserine/homoserine lactone efflux protein
VPDFTHAGLFVGASLALLMTPGPAVLYIVTRSLGGGRRAGLISVLGICTGTLVHVVAAALGLSALLVSSALAFNVVRWLGALYLIILGVRTLCDRNVLDVGMADRGSVDALHAVFTQGVVVNVLNPHTAFFFFAFLPQFVNPSTGHVPLQMMTLGLSFVALSAVTDSGWAIAAGTAGSWIKGSPRFARSQRLLTGGALLALGATAAISGANRK